MEGLLVRFQRRGLGQGLQRAAAAGPNLGGAVGLLVARRQPVVKGMLYLVAQVVGALLAAKVAPSIGDLSSYSAGRPVGEFVGAGLLILTVMAVSDKWVPKAGGGVAIGAALGAGLLLTHGVLNPAVALAMGLGRSPALWAAALGGVPSRRSSTCSWSSRRSRSTRKRRATKRKPSRNRRRPPRRDPLFQLIAPARRWPRAPRPPM